MPACGSRHFILANLISPISLLVGSLDSKGYPHNPISLMNSIYPLWGLYVSFSNHFNQSKYFKIYVFFNLCSTLNKLPYFRSFVYVYERDIMIVKSTWFNDSVCDSYSELAYHYLLRHDQALDRGNWILNKSSYAASIAFNELFPIENVLILGIHPRANTTLIVGAICRPPSRSRDLDENVCQLLESNFCQNSDSYHILSPVLIGQTIWNYWLLWMFSPNTISGFAK